VSVLFRIVPVSPTTKPVPESKENGAVQVASCPRINGRPLAKESWAPENEQGCKMN
jgi:hypothetical protein